MKDLNTLLSGLRDLMATDDYPVAGPVDAATLAGLINNAPPADWDFHKKSAYEDIRLLLINRKDYAEMFSIMDGAEYNGMTLYNLVQTANNGPFGQISTSVTSRPATMKSLLIPISQTRF
ncbi:hypothetical protein WDV93_25570 [Pantoea ananatis]